jgi:hypothetical protein
MRIKETDFLHGGEVDCLARYKFKGRAAVGRLSIRRTGPDYYELYVEQYIPPNGEIVIAGGSLQWVVECSNEISGLHDEVVDNQVKRCPEEPDLSEDDVQFLKDCETAKKIGEQFKKDLQNGKVIL